jgi:phospholipid transport system substrate-binding protein
VGAASEDELAASRAVVEGLHDNLLRSMRAGDRWSFDTRRAELDPVLRRSFDFSFMAEKSVGRHWATLAPEQRSALIETMARLASANYASRFRSYEGEGFEISASEPASYQTTLVRSQITRTDGDAVELDYRLRSDASGQPLIVDIFLNGTVSELALRRAEYSAVIGREGFDALLEALRAKIEDLRATQP